MCVWANDLRTLPDGEPACLIELEVLPELGPHNTLITVMRTNEDLNAV